VTLLVVAVKRNGRTVVAYVAVALLLVSACGVSPDARTSRELADTVKIEGYHRVSESHKAETTLLYFVGPPGIDLPRAVSARGWSPEPPPSGLPEGGAYKWVAFSSANSDKHRCSVVVSTLRPGFESSAIELSDAEKRELAEGRLVYVKVVCICAGGTLVLRLHFKVGRTCAWALREPGC